MGTFTKSLCLSLALVSSFWLYAEESIHLKGDYFIFSDDLNYIYGGSKIILKDKNYIIRGDQFYYDVNLLQGILYGKVELQRGKTETKKDIQACDAIFFKGIPPNLLLISFDEEISIKGDASLLNPFLTFAKRCARHTHPKGSIKTPSS